MTFELVTRVSFGLAAFCAIGCRAVREVPATVERPKEPHVFETRTDLRGEKPGTQVLELIRVTRVDVDGSGTKSLPLRVSIRGEGERVEVVYNELGGSITRTTDVRFTGEEGVESAAGSAPFLHFWAGVVAREDGLLLGLPGEDGAVHKQAFAPPFLELKDPHVLLSYAPPDLELAAIASLAPGAWSPGELRERGFLIEHTERFPPLEGRVRLRYRGLRDGFAVFDAEVLSGGRVFPAELPVEQVLERTAAGEVGFTPGGHIAFAELDLEAVSRWPRPGRPAAEMGRVEAEVTIARREAAAPRGAESWEGSDGEEFARLMDLRQTDSGAFLTAILERTSERAAAMVSAVRPEARLEGTARLVRGLEDDIALRGEGGVLWITRWRSLEAAREFFRLYGSILRGGDLELAKMHVVAMVGEAPAGVGDALLSPGP